MYWLPRLAQHLGSNTVLLGSEFVLPPPPDLIGRVT